MCGFGFASSGRVGRGSLVLLSAMGTEGVDLVCWRGRLFVFVRGDPADCVCSFLQRVQFVPVTAGVALPLRCGRCRRHLHDFSFRRCCCGRRRIAHPRPRRLRPACPRFSVRSALAAALPPPAPVRVRVCVSRNARRHARPIFSSLWRLFFSPRPAFFLLCSCHIEFGCF